MDLISNRIILVLILFWSCKSGECICESNKTNLDGYCLIQSICFSEEYYAYNNEGCNYGGVEHSVTFVGICNIHSVETNINLQGQHDHVKHIFVIDSPCIDIPIVQNAHNVEDYNLHGNKLEIITINQRFPSLKVLDISDNVVSEILIKDSDYVCNLLKLNASFNNIQTLKDLVFNGLEHLEILDLSSNRLEKLNFLSFSGLTNLKMLRLANNRLTQVDTAFYSLSKIQEIDLSFNLLTEINKEDFKMLVHLKTITLSNNKITDINYAFSSLTQLESIKLDFNQITEIKKEYFENQINLKVILLNSNNITNVEWKFLELKPLLVKFDVSNNSIRTIDRKSFTNNTALEYVDLSNNRLEKLFPNTFINKNLTFFSIKDNILQGRLEKGMFEGMKSIGELDFSYQKVDTIMNYAFNGLINLVKLLLNNNNINAIQNKAFRSLFSLEILDLSNNMLHTIDFEKNDLNKLRHLNLQHNFIDSLGATSFLDTGSIILLDLSYNNITHLEKDVFGFLHEVVNLNLSNNAIAGALESGTFEGLESLPSLDLSYTSINQIKNKSFDGLLQLNKLNISHSDVHELQFNAFCDLNQLESMDLSYNKLTVLNVNFSCIDSVKFLSLKQNLLTTLGPILLQNLIELDLSFNKLTNIKDTTFENFKVLSILNLSYNNFTFTFRLVKHIKNISSLSLAGLSLEVTNTKYENQEIVKKLDLTDCNIVNITIMRLENFVNCDELNLSGNKLPSVEYGMISKNTKIKIINLSFNKISYLQPGTFKDNHGIEVLNVAHNKIFELEYGIFKGMWRLNHLDISFNDIRILNRGIFDETLRLTTLIADHNQIKTIDYKDFLETPLQTLSIGGNPISCLILRHFHKFNQKISLATLVPGYHKSNYNGITCYSGSNNIILNGNSSEILFNNNTFERQEQLLEDIKDLIKAVAAKDNNKNGLMDNANTLTKWYTLVNNIQEYFNKSNDINGKLLDKIDDDSKIFTDSLNKIIRTFNFTLARLQINQNEFPGESKTSNNMLNHLLQDLNDKIEDFDKRISKMEKSHKHLSDNNTDILGQTSNDRENSPFINEEPVRSEEKTFVFQNICLGFISIVILCIILHKIYKSDIFVPVRRSVSTRQINESMETTSFRS